MAKKQARQIHILSIIEALHLQREAAGKLASTAANVVHFLPDATTPEFREKLAGQLKEAVDEFRAAMWPDEEG